VKREKFTGIGKCKRGVIPMQKSGITIFQKICNGVGLKNYHDSNEESRIANEFPGAR